MGVRVGEAREDDPAQAIRPCRGRRPGQRRPRSSRRHRPRRARRRRPRRRATPVSQCHEVVIAVRPPRPGRTSTAASASTPASQSSTSACSAGLCDTPVGLRTKSIAVGTPAAARMPASWPGGRREQRSRRPVPQRRADHAGEPLGQARRRTRRAARATPPSPRTSCRRAPARSAAWALTAATTASTASWSAAAHVEPGTDPFGDGVGGAGVDLEPADGGPAPPRRACLLADSAVNAAVSIGSARSSMRVVPAWSARPPNSRRHRPCGQIAVATPTGAGGPASGATSQRPCSTCSSTKTAIEPGQLGAAEGRRVERHTRAVVRLRDGHARPVGEGQSPRGVEGTGGEPGTQAGHAETGALLLDEHRDAQRAYRREPTGAQDVDGGERRDDPERTVERAAVGHRVEVAAGDDPRVAPRRRPGATTPRGCRCCRSPRSSRRAAQASRNHASASRTAGVQPARR